MQHHGSAHNEQPYVYGGVQSMGAPVVKMNGDTQINHLFAVQCFNQAIGLSP